MKMITSCICYGVAAHLYAEFDGQFIDLQKLHLALQRLYKEHPILVFA
jgi:hypothetical protein